MYFDPKENCTALLNYLGISGFCTDGDHLDSSMLIGVIVDNKCFMICDKVFDLVRKSEKVKIVDEFTFESINKVCVMQH